MSSETEPTDKMAELATRAVEIAGSEIAKSELLPDGDYSFLMVNGLRIKIRETQVLL